MYTGVHVRGPSIPPSSAPSGGGLCAPVPSPLQVQPVSDSESSAASTVPTVSCASVSPRSSRHPSLALPCHPHRARPGNSTWRGLASLAGNTIVDRVLENGRLLLLDGPSYRTRHLDLPAEDTHDSLHQPARISGNQPAEFPEPTVIYQLDSRTPPLHLNREMTHARLRVQPPLRHTAPASLNAGGHSRIRVHALHHLRPDVLRLLIA